MILDPKAEAFIFVSAKRIANPSLLVICGWCPGARQKTLAAQAEGKMVSHGMCPACQAKFEASINATDHDS